MAYPRSCPKQSCNPEPNKELPIGSKDWRNWKFAEFPATVGWRKVEGRKSNVGRGFAKRARARSGRREAIMNNSGKDDVLRYSSSKSMEKKEKRNQKVCGELG